MAEFKLYPQVAVWEITFVCNMRCRHCGTSAGEEREKELTTDEALKLCDELGEMECEFLTLSGGEPLMRKDWDKLAQRLKQNKVSLGIVTNGYLVEDGVIDKFQELEMGMVGVSFDGTEKTHNEIRRHPHSFQKAYNAFKLLKKREKIPFCAVTQVSKYNLYELEEIKNLLLKAGVPVWRIQMTTITGRMKEESSMTISPQEMVELNNFIVKTKKENKIYVDVGENIGYYNGDEKILRNNLPYLGCYAGCRVIGIESNGNIKGCLSLPEEFVEGNVRDSSLKEIWFKEGAFAYNRQFTLDKVEGFCKGCPHVRFCRCGCANTAYASSGSRFYNPMCLYRMEVESKVEESA
jgi:radical SAM protein with 4Fe4S-binding SPASM domain